MSDRAWVISVNKNPISVYDSQERANIIHNKLMLAGYADVEITEVIYCKEKS